tara:strand:- start:105 stop:290 length:186 start_codon:yes stop_codon:yes gene_type:complete
MMEYAFMGKSLEKVLKPDGSYVWELVELREKQPEPAPEVCKPVRKRKAAPQKSTFYPNPEV